jgi:MraZ protein
MDLLIGEFKATLDDKNRISLPALLRRYLNENNLFLTEGTENCLWLYPSGKWNKMIDTIMKNTDPFSKTGRNLRRRIIGPCQEVEIDKAGRIPVAQSLREFAGLMKDCVVLGQVDYIEIWSEDRYREYRSASNDEFDIASEELSIALKNKRGTSE